MNNITIALPKGRILKELLPILDKVGLQLEDDFFDKDSRKLIFSTNFEHIKVIRVRSFDVATFVSFGAAQMGVVGSDVLEEFNYNNLYSPVNLNIGNCRISIAQPVQYEKPDFDSLSHIRLATKYPNISYNFFSSRSVQAECIKLNGAMELAPKVGLSRYIVDLVSTGETLKANGLEEISTITHVSSKLAINKNAWKVNNKEIQSWLQKFEEAVE